MLAHLPLWARSTCLVYESELCSLALRIEVASRTHVVSVTLLFSLIKSIKLLQYKTSKTPVLLLPASPQNFSLTIGVTNRISTEQRLGKCGCIIYISCLTLSEFDEIMNYNVNMGDKTYVILLK